MDGLIKELDIQAEEIVIRTYKVRHSKADEVSEMILAVLRNEFQFSDEFALAAAGVAGTERRLW